MDLTNSFQDRSIVPIALQKKYSFVEVRNAAAVISSSCPKEWEQVITYLKKYKLQTHELMTPGGSKSLVVASLENLFYADGWLETRVDTEQIVYKVSKRTGERTPIKLTEYDTKGRLQINEVAPQVDISSTFQEGYLIDALKGRLAIDIEWNAKDGNLDRDISAYRAWYDLGLIDGAILITKEMNSCRNLVTKIWSDYQSQLPKDHTDKNKKIPVDLGTTTTTSLEKARERIKRGDAGGCPILIVGLTERCWDKQPYSR